MRRIYESSALHRDDDEPASPRERNRDVEPRSIRYIDSTSLSRRLVPTWLRHLAISIEIETPQTKFDRTEHVPFQVTMKNALPVPITIETRSPLLWTWAVDGIREASHVFDTPPAEERGFTFDRGERKRFRRRWDGMFKVADDRWEPADPGEYTLSAGINVPEPARNRLYSETTVSIRE